MQRLEVNGTVRPIHGSLGVKRLRKHLEAKPGKYSIDSLPKKMFHLHRLDMKYEVLHTSYPAY